MTVPRVTVSGHMDADAPATGPTPGRPEPRALSPKPTSAFQSDPAAHHTRCKRQRCSMLLVGNISLLPYAGSCKQSLPRVSPVDWYASTTTRRVRSAQSGDPSITRRASPRRSFRVHQSCAGGSQASTGRRKLLSYRMMQRVSAAKANAACESASSAMRARYTSYAARDGKLNSATARSLAPSCGRK